ncbi:MAG: SMC-Scp complex subunit ScpB, partial [Pirellulaceae bacterium]
AIYSGCMADVHKSNSDDPELPESETVFDGPAGDLRLPAAEEDAAGRGPSLDELSGIYAALLQRENGEAIEPAAGPGADGEQVEDATEDVPREPEATVEVTPTSILEAMLFVGNPENEPLKSKQVAALLRGVSPREVDRLVTELNERYERRGCPYRVDSVGAGYLMRLHPDFSRFRDKFYGRIREARLSQQAIDVLAIVAYRPGATRAQIDELRGRNSSSILSQLVRRQLLRLERSGDKPRKPCYFTTDRFLALFGLEQLEELPQSQELEYED